MLATRAREMRVDKTPLASHNLGLSGNIGGYSTCSEYDVNACNDLDLVSDPRGNLYDIAWISVGVYNSRRQ